MRNRNFAILNIHVPKLLMWAAPVNTNVHLFKILDHITILKFLLFACVKLYFTTISPFIYIYILRLTYSSNFIKTIIFIFFCSRTTYYVCMYDNNTYTKSNTQTWHFINLFNYLNLTKYYNNL